MQAVGAEPLICVNFESDGRRQYMKANDSVRTGDAKEAAAWVAYCNDPGNADRQAHGNAAPLGVRYWQIGNETSYDKNGFDLETAARKTIEFAKAMRAADPAIRLIAWGDSGWAGRMADVAGEHVQYLAFHHMFDPDSPQRPVLRGELYRRDPDATWEQLMEAWQQNDAKIRGVRDSLGGRQIPLAMTECHFAIPGRDRCDVLATWAAGVSYARILNNHQRHGDVLKIATAADFCGTRWQNNAVMIPVPKGNNRAYLQPVARVMQLYRHHIGSHAVKTGGIPDGLDVVASRRGNTRVSPRREHATRHARDGYASDRRAHDPRRTGVRDSRRSDDRVVVLEQRRCDEDGGTADDCRWHLGLSGGLGVCRGARDRRTRVSARLTAPCASHSRSWSVASRSPDASSSCRVQSCALIGPSTIQASPSDVSPSASGRNRPRAHRLVGAGLVLEDAEGSALTVARIQPVVADETLGFADDRHEFVLDEPIDLGAVLLSKW